MNIKKIDIILLIAATPMCAAVCIWLYYDFAVWLANFFMCSWGGICT